MRSVHSNALQGLKDLREIFYTVTEIYGTCVAYHEKKQGFYQHASFGRVRTDVEALGTAFGGLLPPAPRVLLLGKACYIHTVSFLALLSGGGVPILADREIEGEVLAATVREARVDAVLCERELADRVTALGLPVVYFDTVPQLIGAGKEALQAGDESFCTRTVDPAATAVEFYRGGAIDTAFTQAALASLLKKLFAAHTVSMRDIFLSVLPPSRADVCIYGLLLPFCCGASVAFAEGLGTLMRNMREIHPTCMVVAPYLAQSILDKFWQLAGDDARVCRAVAVSDPVHPLAVQQALKARLLKGPRAPFGGALRTLLLVGGEPSAALQQGLLQIGILTKPCSLPAHTAEPACGECAAEVLEQLLAEAPLIREVAVVSVPNEAHTGYEAVALILPDTARAAELLGEGYTNEALESAIGAWLTELNQTLPPDAAIALFTLRDAPLPRDAAGQVLREELAAETEAAAAPTPQQF